MSIETSATSVSQDSHSIPPKTTHEKGAEIKRRSTRKTKVALLIGYDGSPFHGMQFNHDPQHPTIEEALYRTLCDANLISESNRGEDWYKKVSWQRASRTDRGVHALRNLVSLRIEHDNGEDVVQAGERLKRALTCGPYKNSLILYSLLPTTRSFNCYEMCTHREYTYILPAYCLFSGQSYRTLQQMFWAEIKRTHQKVEDGAQSTSNEAPNRLSVPQHLFEALCQCSHDAWESGLVHTSLLPRVNQLLSEYLGTHSFHNFTPKGRSSDPSMKRFITKASAEVLELPSTLQVAAHGSESSKFLGKYVVQFQIHGQSFMLHQIRKMVSAVLLMVLGDVEGSLSRMLHKDVTLEIPMLPSNGLMLSNLTLEKYESRLAYIEKCKGRQVTHKEAGAEAFNMASFDDLVHKFREERIIPSCLEFEFNNRVMARWLLSASFPQTLDSIPAALMNAGHRDHHSISMKRGRVATDDVIPSSTSPYTERPP